MTPQQAELVDAPDAALSCEDAVWTWCLLRDCQEDPAFCHHNQTAIASAQIAGDLGPVSG